MAAAWGQLAGFLTLHHGIHWKICKIWAEIVLELYESLRTAQMVRAWVGLREEAGPCAQYLCRWLWADFCSSSLHYFQTKIISILK